METNNHNEQFEPDWMSNSDEVAVRLMADPTTFMRLYSSRFPDLAEVHQQMALDSNDTMIFIGVIKRILEKLPKKIRKAQEGVDSAKLRKLGEIQQTIQDILQAGTVNILRPTILMHEVIYEYIDRHEKELNDYLLEVWKLKNQITDIQPAAEKQEVANEKTLTIEHTTTSGKVTQAQLALYYFYCHQKKCLPDFNSGELEQSYKNATAPYGLSWKPFQQHYNRFKQRDERLADGSRKALLAAMKMLNQYPAAFQLAQDELNTAKSRKPLT